MLQVQKHGAYLGSSSWVSLVVIRCASLYILSGNLRFRFDILMYSKRRKHPLPWHENMGLIIQQQTRLKNWERWLLHLSTKVMSFLQNGFHVFYFGCNNGFSFVGIGFAFWAKHFKALIYY